MTDVVRTTADSENLDAAPGSRPEDRAAASANSVADGLRAAMVSGQLAPGTPITERKVLLDYNCSRATVREAIQYLVAEGYLVRRRHHSAVVRPFEEKDLRDLCAARLLLEKHAAAHCSTMNVDDRENLREALRAYVASLDHDDLAESARRHRDLHVAIVATTDNATLARLERSLMIEATLAVAVIDARRDDVEHMKRVHTELVDAFIRGDETQATRLTVEHLDMVEKASIEELSARRDADGPRHS